MGQPKADVAPKQAPLYRTIPYLSDHKCHTCKTRSSSRWYALIEDASKILCNACRSKEANERRHLSKACAGCGIKSCKRWHGGPSPDTKLCQTCHSKGKKPVPQSTCAIVRTPGGLVALAEAKAEGPKERSAALVLASLEEQRDAAEALGIPLDALNEDGAAAERELKPGSGKVQGLLESGSELEAGALMAVPASGGPQGLESAPSSMGGAPGALLTLGASEKEAGGSALVESDAPLRGAQSGEQENEKLPLVIVEQTGASAPGETPIEARREQDAPGGRTRSTGKNGGGPTKRPAQEAAASPSAKRAKKGAKENPVTKLAESNALSVVVSTSQGGPMTAAATTPVKLLCGDCGKESTGKFYKGSKQCRNCYSKAYNLKRKHGLGSVPKELKVPPSADQKTAQPPEELGHAPPTAKKRKLAETSHNTDHPPGTEKKATPQPVSSEPGVCADCGTRETSSWYAGPGGPRTRCRKCRDLHWGGPCHLCAATSSCMWYGGPNGPRTTCYKCYKRNFKPGKRSMSKSARPAVRKRSLREIEERSPSTSARLGEGTSCVVQPRKDGNAGRKPSRAELVSRRVGVWWPMDKTFYSGRVIRFTRWNNKHEILYDDGVQEELDLSKEQWKLMDDEEEGEHEYGNNADEEETEEDNKRGESEQHNGKAEERNEREENEERNGTEENEKRNETLGDDAQNKRAEGEGIGSEGDGDKGRNGLPGLDLGSGERHLQEESAKTISRKRPGDDVPVGGSGKASRRKLSPQGQARPARRSGGKTKKPTGTKRGKVGATDGKRKGPAAATPVKASEAGESASEAGGKAFGAGETASEAGEKASEAAEKASEAGEKASEAAGHMSKPVENASKPGEKASEATEKASEAAEEASEIAEKASEGVVEQAARASEEDGVKLDKAFPGEAGPPAEKVSETAQQASAPLEILSEAAGTVEQAAGATEEGGGELEEAPSGGGVQDGGLGNGGDAEEDEASSTPFFVAKEGMETVPAEDSPSPSTIGVAAPSLPPLVDTTETPQRGNLSQSPLSKDHQLPSLKPLGESSLVVPFAETAALIEQQIRAAHVETEGGPAKPGIEQGPADVASVAADVAEIGAEPAPGKGPKKMGAPGEGKGGDGIAEPNVERGPSDVAQGTGGKEEASADVAKSGNEVATADAKEVGASELVGQEIADKETMGALPGVSAEAAEEEAEVSRKYVLSRAEADREREIEPSADKGAEFPLEDVPGKREEPDAARLEKEGPGGLEGTLGESLRAPQSAEQTEELGPGREPGEGAHTKKGGVSEAEPVPRGAEGDGKKQDPECEDKMAAPNSDEPEGRRGLHSDKPEIGAPPQLGEGAGTRSGADMCQLGGGSREDPVIAPEVNDAWEHLLSGFTGAKTRSLSGDHWPGELVNGISGGLDGWQERALAAEKEVARLRKQADGDSKRAWFTGLERCTSRSEGGHVAESMELKEKVHRMFEIVEGMREEIFGLHGALEAQALCGSCAARVSPKPLETVNNGRGCESEPLEATALLGTAAGSAGPSKLPPETSAVVETSRGYCSDVRAADLHEYVLRGLTSENDRRRGLERRPR